jgi:hypothetical protein
VRIEQLKALGFPEWAAEQAVQETTSTEVCDGGLAPTLIFFALCDTLYLSLPAGGSRLDYDEAVGSFRTRGTGGRGRS